MAKLQLLDGERERTPMEKQARREARLASLTAGDDVTFFGYGGEILEGVVLRRTNKKNQNANAIRVVSEGRTYVVFPSDIIVITKSKDVAAKDAIGRETWDLRHGYCRAVAGERTSNVSDNGLTNAISGNNVVEIDKFRKTRT